jgi:hypothetical protein
MCHGKLTAHGKTGLRLRTAAHGKLLQLSSTTCCDRSEFSVPSALDSETLTTRNPVYIDLDDTVTSTAPSDSPIQLRSKAQVRWRAPVAWHRYPLLHKASIWIVARWKVLEINLLHKAIIRLRFGLSHDGRAYRPNLPGNFVSFGIDRITMKLNRVRRRCRDVSRCLCSMLLFLLIRTWMQVKVSIYLSP